MPAVPVEIAHISPWAKCKTHTFNNLIALCPTCHTRYDIGEIDRTAMHQYKFNLSLRNSRYGDLEQRLMRKFAKDRTGDEVWLIGELEILLAYLLEDGVLEDAKKTRTMEGGLVRKLYS